MPQSKPYLEIAHLTDTHIFADPQGGLFGLESERALREVIALVQRRQPNLVMVTGDLIHDERAEAYARLSEILADLGVPVYCLAGNHDDLDLMRVSCAGGELRCDTSIDVGDWQILSVNSVVPGQVGGHLDANELELLRRRLQTNRHRPTLVCLHHQPVAIGSQWLDRIGIDNGDELFSILDVHPQVKAVFWGHVHQEYHAQRNGMQLLATPSTCVQFKPVSKDFTLDMIPPGFRWLHLHKDGHLETGVERLREIPGKINSAAKGY
ncbi:MAG: 3',5'-cyclic-AMP phosphodiesterase [Gammaproteobacteria bacterium]|nr:3',5'-cyclic-AMP phosphodiesterase [Gammaproteobacteria bacterium]